METVLIKSPFADYMHGDEVEGQAILFPYDKLQKGDHILAYKESITNKSDRTYRLSDYIGVEGEVTEVGVTFVQNESRKIQFIKVKKIIAN